MGMPLSSVTPRSSSRHSREDTSAATIFRWLLTHTLVTPRRDDSADASIKRDLGMKVSEASVHGELGAGCACLRGASQSLPSSSWHRSREFVELMNSTVAAGSGQRLGSSEHIGGTRDDSGEVTCCKGPDDRAVGLAGGSGSRVTTAASMIPAVAAEEAARLVCQKSTIVAAFAWRA
ncbi:hypothetical protein MRX96_015888 [Rhipicephalus microplus]